MRKIRIYRTVDDATMKVRITQSAVDDSTNTCDDPAMIRSALASATFWDNAIIPNFITADGYYIKTADGYMFNVKEE